MDIRLKDSDPAPSQEAEAPAEEAQPASETVAVASATPESSPASATTEEENEDDRNDSCFKILGGKQSSLSMEFQNANIKNIFRVISEVSGFSLVLSPDVVGTVSIRLVDVPWNKAFELILENNVLGRICEGNVIRIVPNATLLAAEVLEPLVTEMIRINFATTEDMVKNLTGLKSPRGSITADARTNTLILTDIPEKVDEMISVIKTLDVKTPQVMIESKIIEVTRTFSQQLGIQLGVFTSRIDTSNPDGFPALIQTGTGLNEDGTNGGFRAGRNIRGQTETSIATDGLNPGFNIDLGIPGTPAGSFGVLLGTLNLDHALDIQVEALEAQGKLRTLATPKVTTLDNKEARILSGTRLPYQTSTSNTGTQIQFIDASLELKVTPHITADENVYMKITATQNNADFSNAKFGVPSINTKEAMTEVLVKNGTTTVLGGIYTKTTSETRNRVPFFADIPIIGYLFRNRLEADDIVELLIFVSPTIVESTGSFSNK
jgi:type IV pilus assembly protein PilQ